MNSLSGIIDFFRGRRLITNVSVSVTRKWSLPSYSSVEFHQGISATGILENPEKLSKDLNEQALKLVEERGKEYLKKAWA